MNAIDSGLVFWTNKISALVKSMANVTDPYQNLVLKEQLEEAELKLSQLLRRKEFFSSGAVQSNMR